MRIWAATIFCVMLAGCLQGASLLGEGLTVLPNGLVPDCDGAEVVLPETGVCGWFLAPGPGRHYETSLKSHPTNPGTILVTWTERSSGSAKIWSTITADAGETWRTMYMHDPSVVAPPGSNPPYGFDSIAEFDHQGNPIVFFGGEGIWYARVISGVGFVYASVSDRMTVAASHDEGRSWAYHALHDDRLEGLLIATDFMDIGVSPDSGHMIVMAQTFRTTPVAAFVYTPATTVGAAPLESAGTYFWTSEDGGKTWSKARLLDPGQPRQYLIVPRVTMGPGGLVVATVMLGTGLWSVPDPTSEYHGLYVVISRDYGRSFEKPVQIVAPGGDAWLGLGAPVIREGANGSLEVDIILNELEKVLLVSSKDAGKTWSKPTQIAAAPAGTWNWWSIPASDREGGLQVISQYSNLCDDPQPPLRWGMQLHSYTRTDSVTLNLTEEQDRAPTGCWASNDYGGVDVASDGSVWAAWSDPRMKVDQPQIAISRLVGR